MMTPVGNNSGTTRPVIPTTREVVAELGGQRSVFRVPTETTLAGLREQVCPVCQHSLSSGSPVVALESCTDCTGSGASLLGHLFCVRGMLGLHIPVNERPPYRHLICRRYCDQNKPTAFLNYCNARELNALRDRSFLSRAPGASPVGLCEGCGDMLFTCNAALAHVSPTNPEVDRRFYTEEERCREENGLLTCPQTTRPCSWCGLLDTHSRILGHEVFCADLSPKQREQFKRYMKAQQKESLKCDMDRRTGMSNVAAMIEFGNEQRQLAQEQEREEQELAQQEQEQEQERQEQEARASPVRQDSGWDAVEMEAAIAASIAQMGL